jgi:GTPase SAR1 family protein
MCHVLQEHGETIGRSYKVCNLDPAAEVFKYKVDIDIRDLISLDDVQEIENWGPNGGLIYCMEHLIENIDWLTDELNEFADDSFVLFDCPGQIELYSHLDVMTRLCQAIARTAFNVCAVYCADGTQLGEPTKYVSTCLTSISTMMQLQLPHLNVLTKCDKVTDKAMLERISSIMSCQDLFLPGTE